jgi:hypothetical protein
MWMNESEIDDTLDYMTRRAPEYAPYARYLSDWRHTVNANSDGWPYWSGGSRCANTLSALLTRVRDAGRGWSRENQPLPTHAEFRKALSPIKGTATRHKLPAPVLGAVTAQP